MRPIIVAMGSGAHAEEDLATAMARDLLGGDDLGQCLLRTAQRVAATLALPWAAVVLTPSEGDESGIPVALRDERGKRVGTLVLPGEVPELTLRRARDRIVPVLEALLAAALERRRLRRGDAVKTAILRSFSHDLRSQLTALMAAAQGLDSVSLSDADRCELAAVVDGGAARIAGLVDGLLNQQRLDAGAAEPQRSWCALDQVLATALSDFGLPAATFSVAVGDDLAICSPTRPATRAASPSSSTRARPATASPSASPTGGRACAGGTRPRVRGLPARGERPRRSRGQRAGVGDRARLRGGQRRAHRDRVHRRWRRHLRRAAAAAHACGRAGGAFAPPARRSGAAATPHQIGRAHV